MERSAYVEDKDYRGLLTSFELKFDRRFVRCFIWKNEAALRRNTDFRNDQYFGAYVHYPARRPRSGLFGEVHLVKKYMGVGYVAHELQHFFFDWLQEYTFYFVKFPVDISERLAWITGEITRDFWNAYYKFANFKVTGKGKKVKK